MKKLCLMLVAVAAVLFSAVSRSEAAVTFDYIALPSNAASTNPVTPGVVTYDIFLRETLTGGSAELVNATGGLIGGGFFINLTGGSGTTITSVDFDPSFGTQLNPNPGPTGQRNFTSTQARLGENAQVNVLMQQFTSTDFRAKLGTLTLQAASGSSTFSVSPYSNAPKGTFGGSGTNGNSVFGPQDLSKFYDADVSNNAGGDPGLVYTGALSSPAGSLTVNVGTSSVPEPSSMILGGFLAFGCFGAYRRRRTAVSVEKA